MFYGQWNSHVDYKWRVYIPCQLVRDGKIGNYIVVSVNEEDGCIRIENPPINQQQIKDPASVYILSLRESKNHSKRFVVPKSLRESTSFYFGRKVTFVGKGDHLEIWPRLCQDYERR